MSKKPSAGEAAISAAGDLPVLVHTSTKVGRHVCLFTLQLTKVASGSKVKYYPIPRKLSEATIKRNKSRKAEKNKHINNEDKQLHVNSKVIVNEFNFGLEFGYPYNIIKTVQI